MVSISVNAGEETDLDVLSPRAQGVEVNDPKDGGFEGIPEGIYFKKLMAINRRHFDVLPGVMDSLKREN